MMTYHRAFYSSLSAVIMKYYHYEQLKDCDDENEANRYDLSTLFGMSIIREHCHWRHAREIGQQLISARPRYHYK